MKELPDQMVSYFRNADIRPNARIDKFESKNNNSPRRGTLDSNFKSNRDDSVSFPASPKRSPVSSPLGSKEPAPEKKETLSDIYNEHKLNLFLENLYK